MLRLVLLVLYLAASFSASSHTKIGDCLDPDGLHVQSADGGGAAGVHRGAQTRNEELKLLVSCLGSTNPPSHFRRSARAYRSALLWQG